MLSLFNVLGEMTINPRFCLTSKGEMTAKASGDLYNFPNMKKEFFSPPVNPLHENLLLSLCKA